MVALVTNGEQTFLDINGDPLEGGKVYFYVPGTSTPSTTWSDSDGTVANANPVVLNQAGRAIIWGRGKYRQVVQDRFGTAQWDVITDTGVASAGSTTIIDGGLTVNGTLTATNANLTNATIQTLAVNGTGTFNGDIFSNGTLWAHDVSATGAITGASIGVTGNGTIGGHLLVSGTSELVGDTLIDGVLAVHGDAAFTGENTFIRGFLAGSTDGALYVESNIIPKFDNTYHIGVTGVGWSNVAAYSFTTLSDIRLKADIQQVSPAKCLEIVNSINPSTYRLNTEHMTPERKEEVHCGFIAQDVKKALAKQEFVCGAVKEGEPHLGLAYNEMVAILWGAVRELAQQKAAPPKLPPPKAK